MYPRKQTYVAEALQPCTGGEGRPVIRKNIVACLVQRFRFYNFGRRLLNLYDEIEKVCLFQCVFSFFLLLIQDSDGLVFVSFSIQREERPSQSHSEVHERAEHMDIADAVKAEEEEAVPVFPVEEEDVGIEVKTKLEELLDKVSKSPSSDDTGLQVGYIDPYLSY